MITTITYNWRFSQENGEEFEAKTVGNKYDARGIVKSIVEHPAMGEGDRWYYDIFYEDSSKERIFNPHQVFYL